MKINPQRRQSGPAAGDGAATLNGGGGVESGGKQVRIVRSGHEPSGRVVGETVCKNKYSSYCVADVEPRGGGGNKKFESHKFQFKERSSPIFCCELVTSQKK